jgi:hypothetical protein
VFLSSRNHQFKFCSFVNSKTKRTHQSESKGEYKFAVLFLFTSHHIRFPSRWKPDSVSSFSFPGHQVWIGHQSDFLPRGHPLTPFCCNLLWATENLRFRSSATLLHQTAAAPPVGFLILNFTHTERKCVCGV